VYAEKPSAFVRRIRRLWDASRSEAGLRERTGSSERQQ
jgi:hypothetical protein